MVVLAGFLGLIIGSFLNVVVWRLPRSESLSVPASHCPACGHPIRAHDNIPLLSWIILRGRCRDCGAPISVRYPAVEALTAVSFAATASFVGFNALLPFALWFIAACIAMALIDIDHKRLPNVLTLSTYAVVLVGCAVSAGLEGQWDQFVRALAGGLIMSAGFAALALLVPAGMGFGDVKLALSLGTVMAWYGWAQLAVGTFAGFLLGAVFGVVAMIVGRAGRRTALPFGPFMIAGALLALVVAASVSQWYSGLLQ